ncbi:3-oxoacyl-ACP synthase [Streptomyces nojiriensis]|uniref:3-oxoacyl-ACP synthase n=1 Tax=Streptomyces nojiriensis TaxID=66374 RepID=A0ABQ3SJR3_9ACTN|nr:3-oxoacyl-[acyl-carrier-protein] synthase III C-terminal domain-containing protein [Streptomyces nojiriensis]QTI49978.1 3-oxoacyl-[acyl-carrier-protein] synthase 3 protein 1 [Streptomyces nojiriensis]GGS21894.1 3-oxoacyl-ACP synthase [Streptomyces nojiriensis]GHI68373.1 3-oxoacyl-ACP synthase [Streptomyces nojiriensis]
MNPYSRITHAAVHLPARRQHVTEIERLLRRHSPALNLPAGLLQRTFGLHERAVADPGDLPSDLAARAAARLLRTARLVPADIDLLLFAAVSADVREPANAHIVAAKTGVTCQAFDIGDACNGVIDALQVADALIRTGRHRRVLITCGETLTRLSRWHLTRDQLRTGLTSLTGADLGAALLVEASPVPGITGSVFLANSAGWPAATLYDPHHAPDHPQGLHVDSEALLGSFVDLDVQAAQWLKEQHVDVRELDLVCVHQPSVPFMDTFRTRMGIDTAQIVPTFPHTGNAAAATLPLQLAHAVGHNRLAPGDQVALFGLASGASGAVILLRW